MVNVAADIDEVRDVILALIATLTHDIGQERMRGLYDISPQPNSTPMSGPRGRRNNKKLGSTSVCPNVLVN